MNMTANKVAKAIKDIVDNFWKGKLQKSEAKKEIHYFWDDPELRVKICRGEDYTGVFKNIMGQRRIDTFEQLL